MQSVITSVSLDHVLPFSRQCMRRLFACVCSTRLPMLYCIQLLVAAADGRSDEIHELLKEGANINIEYQNQVPDRYVPGMPVSDIVLR